MPYKDKAKEKESKAKYDAKRAGRTRNFATIVYPESAPADWMERLDQYHIATLISPLHDKDTNPSGEPKKSHYHVMLMFESPANYESKVAPIFAEIGGVGRETIGTARGYARYLCHLDNPEKAQYSPSEVRCMSGADYYGIVNLPTDDIKIITEIKNYCRKNSVYSLAEIIDIAETLHPEWYSTIVLSRCYVIDKYIKSLAWEFETGYVRVAERQKMEREESQDEKGGDFSE